MVALRESEVNEWRIRKNKMPRCIFLVYLVSRLSQEELQSMPGVDYESMLSELGKYGASFILATQSLAKLEDLSRTMRDTILANVGCLAVFQVAGSDARHLVWELGKDRVSEDDIVSLDVHHCYVRATVGTERMPAFSMKVLKPEPGDPQVAARIRADAAAYLRPNDAGSASTAACGGPQPPGRNETSPTPPGDDAGDGERDEVSEYRRRLAAMEEDGE